MSVIATAVALVCVLSSRAPAAARDWPTLRGDAVRSGFVAGTLRPQSRLAWVRHFPNERFGTAVEPIVAKGRVYVATHGGNLYALDADTGAPIWRFTAGGPFLHSPAVSAGVVVAPCADGRVFGLDAASGSVRWYSRTVPGGFSASPAIVRSTAIVGSRGGDVVALTAGTGRELWRRRLGVPIRQTAASDGRRVYLTAEDLRVRCLDAATGRVLWTSTQLSGQTARDYCPVLVRTKAGMVVVVRTNPAVSFSRRISEDRRLLCSIAGVDDSSWQALDAWTKSPQAMGVPSLWAAEQKAVRAYLARNREAQTFFVLRADTGRLLPPPPVMWAAGCQGVPSPPVIMPDGRLATLFRSAYGNWNLGVAPLVSLGLLDLSRGAIEPLRHAHGTQPPWNTFWGTADESQALVGMPGCLLMVHQATLSMLDLSTGRLERIWGERDTFGGFRGLPWARNEWHGPARGSAAVVGNRIYWITGSRILCIEAGQVGDSVPDMPVRPQDMPRRRAVARTIGSASRLTVQIQEATLEVLSRRWAPLCLEPGLAGREVLFANSSDLFEALAWAYPHLKAPLRARVMSFLETEWRLHNPCSTVGWYSLDRGARREWFCIPPSVLSQSQEDRYHRFGGMYAVWLYAQRSGGHRRILQSWPILKEAFGDFLRSGWTLDGARGDPYANRYLSSLYAFARLSQKVGDAEAHAQATAAARQVEPDLLQWWDRAGALQMPGVAGVAELDRFIGSGNALFLHIRPHKAKLALFDSLTPEVAEVVRAKRPQAVRSVWSTFSRLCPTWHLVGEERQVHYGENYIDPPDFAMSAFRAYAWLCRADAEELAARTDVPFCRADLFHLAKLSIAADRLHKGIGSTAAKR